MMESMARSISTHSFRIALGSRGVDDGGLMRFCISTSPVGRYRVRLEVRVGFFWGSRAERIQWVLVYHNRLHRMYFGFGSLVDHKEFLLGFGYIPRTSASQLAQLSSFFFENVGFSDSTRAQEKAITKEVKTRTRE